MTSDKGITPSTCRDLTSFNPDATVITSEDSAGEQASGSNVQMERINKLTSKGCHSNKTIIAKLGPVVPARKTDIFESAGSESDILQAQHGLNASNSISYKTCTWQMTAALLFSEYICLAIMSFPYSYSILGLVPGLVLTIVIAGLVLYTSIVVWEFTLRHPEVKDVCDIAQMLFWGKTWAWYCTALIFILNNTFIQGLHILVSAKYLNTITNHSQCTVVFAVISAIICWAFSLPRTFNTLSKFATLSTIFTLISVILAAIFAGIEDHPAGYNPDSNFTDPITKIHGGDPIVTAMPVAGTNFIAGMSAFLNISYTFIGQITLPSFIAEMGDPKDFPKALWLVTLGEIVVFGCIGTIVYAYTGYQYITSPAFGSLGNELYRKISFSFMIPTLIFLGVLYASVSTRFIFFRIFEGSRHKCNHTVVGWSVWAGILALTWVGAFIIAEVIPFFSDLLSLMSSLFDSFFGFIFWGIAYTRMQKANGGSNWLHEKAWYEHFMLVFNISIIFIGVFFLVGGTYTSVQSIIDSYTAGRVLHSFTCANNGL